jgi:sugar lactone lactonase YvrE
MKIKIVAVLVMVAASFGWNIEAQIYDTNGDYVQTFAGSGFSGYVDGVGQLTMFNYPAMIAADSSGNLFVVDGGNSLIRKITPDGTVSTFAGGGAGSLPGYGTNVSLSGYIGPSGGSGAMIIDRSNTLLITKMVNTPALLRIRSDGYITSTNLTGIQQSSGLCVDSVNNIYYSSGMFGGNKIYRWRTNGVVEVFAGSGNTGSADGNGIFSSFYNPTALACDSAGNIYVWDSYSFKIRRIDQSQNVTTIAGGNTYSLDGTGLNTSFANVTAMCADNLGNIYFACGSCIRKMNAQTNVVTLAGSFTQTGYTNGTGNLALFNNAYGVCVSGGTIYVADSSNQRIRSITNNPQPQVVTGANLGIGTFAGVTITGVVGRTYQIQSSPNMATWTTRATVLLTSSPYLWIDQNPASGNKFYRALLLP